MVAGERTFWWGKVEGTEGNTFRVESGVWHHAASRGDDKKVAKNGKKKPQEGVREVFEKKITRDPGDFFIGK